MKRTSDCEIEVLACGVWVGGEELVAGGGDGIPASRSKDDELVFGGIGGEVGLTRRF